MQNKEDILKTAEQLLSGDIYEVASRYFSGQMSAAEAQAFDSVMERFPDLKAEVRLHGLAVRAYRVAARTPVREKLDAARRDARRRSSVRRFRRRLAQVSVPVVAAVLLLVALLGGRTMEKPVYYADVNIFGMMFEPHAAGAVSQARLYRLPGADAFFLMAVGSHRLRFLPPHARVGGQLIMDPESWKMNWVRPRADSHRRAICEEMRRLGLPVLNPSQQMARIWRQQEFHESPGPVHNYLTGDGFLEEEDPLLGIPYFALPTSSVAASGQEAEGGWRWAQVMAEE